MPQSFQRKDCEPVHRCTRRPLRPDDRATGEAWEWALRDLACPRCHRSLVAVAVGADRREAVLGHVSGACVERYPVIGGVPRLLLGPARGIVCAAHPEWLSSELGSCLRGWGVGPVNRPDLALVRRFDEEWRSFSTMATTTELDAMFERYFDIVPDDALRDGSLVLDAGCGSGRWAEAVQRRGASVIALDLGLSVELAERNTRATGRVAYVQGDVREPPLADGAFDLVYCLGVLHHIQETERAMSQLGRTVRPGGSFLVYLYYALETRSAAYRAVFRVVDLARRAMSSLPQPLLVVFATVIAALVYWPFSRIAAGLHAIGFTGLAPMLPLSFYANSSFRTMRNDSLDRFGTKLEKRYTRAQVRRLLEGAGLRDVRISESWPYWHASARRPSS